MNDARLLRGLRRALVEVAEPERAAAMRAYAKSAMPFLGVGASPLRRVCREVFADVDFPSAAAFRRAALSLWRGARYREERYCAVELTGHRRFNRFQDLAALPLYEEMIVTGAWWDYVDAIASHRGPIPVIRFPNALSLRLPFRTSSIAWRTLSARPG